MNRDFTKREGLDFLCSLCDTYFTISEPTPDDFARFSDAEILVRKSPNGLSFVAADDDMILCAECLLDHLGEASPNLDVIGLKPEDLGYDSKKH